MDGYKFYEMRGLEIVINGKKISVGIDRGSILVFLHSQNPHRITISGEDDESGLSLEWRNIPLKVGDVLKITAKENLSSDEILEKKEINRGVLLTRYNALRDILIKEGIVKW